MTRTLRLFTILALLSGLLATTFAARPTAAAPAAQAGPQTWTVYVGQMITTETSGKSSWQTMKFYPETITINAGDSIVWKFNGGAEPHNVVFLGNEASVPESPMLEAPAGGQGAPRLVENPRIAFRQGGDTYDGSTFTNSGLIAEGLGPLEYRLTFPQAGSYDYLCTLHGAKLPTGQYMGMAGKVTVQAAGGTPAQTPAQVEAAAMTAMQADQQKARTLEPQVQQEGYSTSPGPNGTTIHHVRAGYMDMENKMEYMRFAQPNLTIHAGDTVEWTSASFHTVTFGDTPPFLIIEAQPSGPPKIVYNPLAFPAGSHTHTGSGYYNSGLLTAQLPPNPPPFLVDKYTLTFTTPGNYGYICMPHYPQGMGGSITVLAAAGTPGMPRTGAPGENLEAALALVAALALAVAGISLRRRRAGHAG